MNIPSVPTDNLYKFSAIFGLILIVFGSYMVFKIDTDIYLELDKLAAKESINELKAEQDSISIKVKVDKINFDSEIKNMSRQVNRYPKLLVFFYMLIAIGIVSSFIGFVCWYHKTQKLNDKILEIETKKVENDNQKVVHSLQFEKEFEVYKELWPELMKLRNATYFLRPKVEIRKEGESEEDVKEKKWAEFQSSYYSCVMVFDHNKPFYPEDIYNEIEKVISTADSEITDFQYLPTFETGYYEEGKKNMDIIINSIDATCLLIRDRIGILKVEK